MHPFFDTSKLDEEALNDKIMDLYRRLHYASAFVGDPQMIAQLEMLLEALELERQERYAKEMFEAWDKQFPDVIESDPEFKKSDKKTELATKKQETQDAPKFTPVFNKTYTNKSSDN